eukprot:TRINITY_DN24137_c0_g2_i1.p1 TRINITY_DN24137_c0_g2~~TRINITY_DN24137_c0_g2_i1.p1  ORF type:complete len:204 (-),score=27.66 TRINITY_DN24137_c0_g2_i1:235-846(-)
MPAGDADVNAFSVTHSVTAESSVTPEGVAGKMDGEKPPMTRMEDIKETVESLNHKYGHYFAKIKPWREFFQLSKPHGEVKTRLWRNLIDFQMNYALIFLLGMIFTIVLDPKCLVVILSLVLIWVLFLKKNDNPEWHLSVGGLELGKSQRWLVLVTLTGLILFCVVGQALFSVAVCYTGLVVVHGILHPLPEDLHIPNDDDDMI